MPEVRAGARRPLLLRARCGNLPVGVHISGDCFVALAMTEAYFDSGNQGMRARRLVIDGKPEPDLPCSSHASRGVQGINNRESDNGA
jgi:hypothetical protein